MKKLLRFLDSILVPKGEKSKETFEYRVIEKKRSDGTSYYIGESTEVGQRTMLTTSPYIRLSRPVTLHSQFEGVPRTPPVFMLVNIEAAQKQAAYGGTAYQYYKFSDPCAVKEAICKVRSDQKNLAYRQVVSEGKCNEYCR